MGTIQHLFVMLVTPGCCQPPDICKSYVSAENDSVKTWKNDKRIHNVSGRKTNDYISQKEKIWKHKTHFQFCDGYLKWAEMGFCFSWEARTRRQPLSDFINKCQLNLQMSWHLTHTWAIIVKNFAENNNTGWQHKNIKVDGQENIYSPPPRVESEPVTSPQPSVHPCHVRFAVNLSTPIRVVGNCVFCVADNSF